MPSLKRWCCGGEARTSMAVVKQLPHVQNKLPSPSPNESQPFLCNSTDIHLHYPGLLTTKQFRTFWISRSPKRSYLLYLTVNQIWPHTGRLSHLLEFVASCVPLHCVILFRVPRKIAESWCQTVKWMSKKRRLNRRKARRCPSPTRGVKTLQ